MRRPESHVIADISERILSGKLPSNWILRTIDPPDYALDKSLEIVEGDVVTGKEILIQLKGTRSPKYRSSGFLSYSMKVKNLKYYKERDAPVLLIVVDINSEICYWSFIQRYIFNFLDIKHPEWIEQKTVTIRIELENQVSNSLSLIIDIAKGGSGFIQFKKMNEFPSKYLTMWENADAIIMKIKAATTLMDKVFKLKFEICYDYDKNGEREKSIEALYGIFESSKVANDDDTIVKSGLLLAYRLNAYGNNELIWRILNEIKTHVDEVNLLSYNLLWKASIAENVYLRLIQRYSSLQMLNVVSKYVPENILFPIIKLEISKMIPTLYETLSEILHCIVESYENEEYGVYVDLIQRLAKLHWIWVYNNSINGDYEEIFRQFKGLEAMLTYGLNISVVISDEIVFQYLLDLACMYHAMEEFSLRDEYIRKATVIAEKLDHKGFLQAIEGLPYYFERTQTIPFLVKYDENKRDSLPVGEKEELELIKMLLTAGGVDYERGEDDLAEMARTGLRDRNPERVLKHCENLYTDLVIWGPIWEPLLLPETGMKILFCETMGSLMGYSLDELLARFKSEHCEGCNQLTPRPENWHWSRQWQEEHGRPEKMTEFIQNWRRAISRG